MSDVIFHVGLPKTASTWLQSRIWPNVPGYRYVGHGDDNQTILGGRRTWTAFWEDPGIWERNQPGLARSFLGVGDQERVRPATIVSQGQVISPKLFTPWEDGDRPYPELFGEHLVALQRCLRKLGGNRLRVVGVFRRQDTWFASWYTQASNRIVGACQADFERTVRRLIGDDYQRLGAYADFHRMYRYLTGALGYDNVLLLPYEQLVTDPDRFLKRILAFLDVSLGVQDDWIASHQDGRANVRRVTDQVWQLRPAYRRLRPRPERLRKILGLPKKGIPISGNRNGQRVSLPSALVHEIHAVYGPANRRLAEELGDDLGGFGYWDAE